MKSIGPIFLLLLSLSSYSQKFNFEHFAQDRLKANFFYDFEQDSKGNLYMASSKGLIIYDGIDFILMNEEDSLQDEFISEIYISQDDAVWIAYYKGGLSKLVDNEIIHLNDLAYVNDLIETPEEGILVLTDEGGMKVVQNQLRSYPKYDGASSIEFFGPNSYMILSEMGELSFSSPEKKQYQIDTDVLSFSVSQDGKQAMALKEEGISIYTVYDDGSPKFETYATFDQLGINSQVTAHVMEDRKAIIGTQDQGIFEIFLNPGFQTYSIQRFTKDNGLGMEKVNSLFIDREKSLWIGSYGEGVSMIPKKRISLHGDLDKSLKSRINAIEYYKGELFVGSENGLRPLKAEHTFDYPTLKNRSITTLKAQNDTLWVGTKNGLFYLFNNKVSKFDFVSLREQPSYINDIELSENTIYVGTNSGLYSYDFNTDTPDHLTTNEGLAHNVIENFIIDDSKTFWFDSPNSPIYSFKSGEYKYHKNIEGYESHNLTDIIQISNGSICFATAGDGIFIYENSEFKSYNSDDGLFNNFIYFVEETQDGKLIVGHKNSVSIIKNISDGTEITDLGHIPELEFILPNSNFISASNYMWIGTYQGAVRIPKINVYDPKFIPELQMESILINQEEYEDKSEINLNYGNYYVEFDFEANYLANAPSVQYEYILEGFDKDWTTLEHDKAGVRYQSLTDGDYVFKLRLILDEHLTEQSYEIKIHIEAPFWKKPWFYAVLTLGILLLFFISLYIIQRRNRSIQKKLTEEVKRRTHDLTVKNEEISTINSELESLSSQYLEAKNVAEYKSDQIEESINYAQNIQKVLFRRKEYNDWTSTFNDFFLLFKPKDMVSGDFYWGHVKDNYAYVAVADCTGHGVPGAMISMLGASFLNDSIAEITETNELLEGLRKRVIEGFNQTEDSLLSDGMDICVLRLEKETLKAQTAGAMNPIYVVRPKSNTEEIPGFKKWAEDDNNVIWGSIPTKQPIGYYFKMSPFEAQEFQLHKGDQVYLLSDGYVDQFGGPDYKKFMRKRLFNLFFEINSLQGKEQKDILWSRMSEWIGTTEQIDDISIIGIKI